MNATDIEGNSIYINDAVYFCDARIYGSNSRKLLCGTVTAIATSGKKVDVYCAESKRTYTKYSSQVVLPQE